MKTLFIDCGMGAAGDMLTAALLELIPDCNRMIDKLNEIGIPGVHYQAVCDKKCGIKGSRVIVTIDGLEEVNHGHGDSCTHVHSHTSLEDIEHIIMNLNLSDSIISDAIKIYKLLAEAESIVHGVSVSEIHFHEVGMMDAIADIVAVCVLINELNVERIIASPVNTGKGTVKCAHGILQVPAPATAEILKGIPAYSGNVVGELCTPTGAALLKYFVDDFSDMPVMNIEKIGYGMGKKDFEIANCIRIMLGDDYQTSKDSVVELSCNIDDMTGEQMGYAIEKILELGALDAYVTQIIMKKSRPGYKLQVICRQEDKQGIVECIFRYTTTIGIRENEYNRYVLKREIETRETEYGSIRIKRSHGYGVLRSKYEYDDLVRIANEHNVSIEEAIRLIEE